MNEFFQKCPFSLEVSLATQKSDSKSLDTPFCRFGTVTVLSCRYCKNSKCKERLSLNATYLLQERSSKRNSIVMSPLPRGFTNHRGLTLVTEKIRS